MLNTLTAIEDVQKSDIFPEDENKNDHFKAITKLALYIADLE